MIYEPWFDLWLPTLTMVNLWIDQNVSVSNIIVGVRWN